MDMVIREIDDATLVEAVQAAGWCLTTDVGDETIDAIAASGEKPFGRQGLDPKFCYMVLRDHGFDNEGFIIGYVTAGSPTNIGRRYSIILDRKPSNTLELVEFINQLVG